MSIFRSRKKSFNVSERDPAYKVKYLGNVQTSLMKGEGCVDKPTAVLWNNFVKTANAGIDMKLSITGSGLKAITKEQGLTEYRAHRISYCIAHPKYPKLFVWVYRHEGKKMKVELRCHAVLCKTDIKAKAMAVQLHDKLAFALSEFVREKTRRQNSRLTLQRTNSLPSSSSDGPGQPLRRKFLATGQNFKPSVDRSASAPKLGSITEDYEPEEIVEEDLEEEEEEDDEEEDGIHFRYRKRSRDDSDLPIGLSLDGVDDHVNDDGDEFGDFSHLSDTIFDIEIGNDVDELKRDEHVQFHLAQDSDDDSSESGFSEQDARESTSTSSDSTGTTDSGIHTQGCESSSPPAAAVQAAAAAGLVAEAGDEDHGTVSVSPAPGGPSELALPPSVATTSGGADS